MKTAAPPTAEPIITPIGVFEFEDELELMVEVGFDVEFNLPPQLRGTSWLIPGSVKASARPNRFAS
jgi:hypothetical protein